MGLEHIKVIAFDADDTLWVNEPFFRKAEQDFCDIFASHLPKDQVNEMLFSTQMKNLPLYGYGIKPFTLSLIETAMDITGGQLDGDIVAQLLQKGKEMLETPVVLLEGIEETLAVLATKYRLVMATKGDLLDQERKLIKSGLQHFFHHIEIVSDKTEKQYTQLVRHLDIQPHEFLMVGNSLKSDIVPVLAMGGHAFHIPYETTWVHEMIEEEITHPSFKTFAQAREILAYL
ncbi:HAD family hydrolase [Aquimarina hainanensis]|uniref:HAD family hydrolase n=1 Tax=Aquimarina hainanensis TaxID=1578017 RepID=A0ABW5NCC9_9FLAO